VAGRASHVEELVTAAGGVNIANDSGAGFPVYSLERLLVRAPEVIILGTHADDAPPMTPLRRLSSVPAVAHDRIYTIDGDLLFRPGPRIVEGAEALAAVIHPNTMADKQPQGGAP
jgi:ABC-type Fe3+-hydroxamate transport system substrate-binding protein